MRIIGGEYKGRKLAEFAGESVRPTSDRAREALFNIFAYAIRGARVLDLFCGSGALGLESLSRGAKEVVFNDLSKDSLGILKKNLSALKITQGERATVCNYDFATCLDIVKGKFDFIFLDPPYKEEFGKTALEKIAKNGLLEENGVAVLESAAPFGEEIAGLEKFDERRYGKAHFSFFKKAILEESEA